MGRIQLGPQLCQVQALSCAVTCQIPADKVQSGASLLDPSLVSLQIREALQTFQHMHHEVHLLMISPQLLLSLARWRMAGSDS